MTQLPPTPKSDKIGLVFLASAVVALLIGAFVMVATEARADEPKLPREGVVSLLYIEGAWTVTLESADASEVKLITPAPQEIACSEEQGQPKNGHPLCDKLSYTFTSQAECVTVQVDWTGNVHNSTDPPACKETPWHSPEPTGSSPVPTDEPVSSETPASTPDPTPSPSSEPASTHAPTPLPTSPTPEPSSSPSTTPSLITNGEPSTPSFANTSGTTSSATTSSAREQLAATGLDRKQLFALCIAAGFGLGLALIKLAKNFRRKRK